ncbi:MAG: aquaporin [Phycisphaerales bacterium]
MSAAPKPLVVEFIGTFFLTFLVALAAGSPLAPLAIGLGLAALVYMGGHVSGAHYNPAVTLATLVLRLKTAREGAGYIVAQVAAALAASAVALFVSGASSAPKPGLRAKAHPDALPRDVGLEHVFIVEALFTLMLVLVILNVAAHPKTKGNQYFGLAIGFTIAAAAALGGPVSGGCYNPAVGLGLLAVHTINAGDIAANAILAVVYVSATCLGAYLGAMIFKSQRVDEPS